MSRSSGKSQGSTGSTGSGRPQTPTGEGENEAPDIDIDPDGISVEIGIGSVSLSPEGTLGLGVEVPLPTVPGISINGGLEINVVTGEIESVTIGADFLDIVEIEFSVEGCELITTTTASIPRTGFSVSHSIHSEIPGCKKEEDEEYRDEDPNDPYRKPISEQIVDPFEKYPNCTIVVFVSAPKISIECHNWRAGEQWVLSQAPTGINSVPEAFKTYLVARTYQYVTGYRIGVSYCPEYSLVSDASELPIDAPPHPRERVYTLSGTLIRPSQRSNPNLLWGICSFGWHQILYGAAMRYFSQALQKSVVKDGRPRKCYMRQEDYYWAPNGYARPFVTGYVIQWDYPKDEPIEYPDIGYLNQQTFKKKKPRKPFSPPPSRKKMSSSSEKSVNRMVYEMYKFLDPVTLSESLVPERLVYPGDSKKLLKLKTLGDFMQYLILEIDKKGFDPFQIEIKDTNAGKSGNQGIKLQINSLSAALQQLLQLLIDTEADGDTQTNMLFRVCVTLGQIANMLAVVERRTENIEEALDYPVEQLSEDLPLSFNYKIGLTTESQNALDQNEEESTEALLPEFLQSTNVKVVTTKFVGNSTIGEKLFEIINILQASSKGRRI